MRLPSKNFSWPPFHQFKAWLGPVCCWFRIISTFGCLCSVWSLGFPSDDIQQHISNVFVGELGLSKRLLLTYICDSHRHDQEYTQAGWWTNYSSLESFPFLRSPDGSWQPDEMDNSAGGRKEAGLIPGNYTFEWRKRNKFVKSLLIQMKTEWWWL